MGATAAGRLVDSPFSDAERLRGKFGFEGKSRCQKSSSSTRSRTSRRSSTGCTSSSRRPRERPRSWPARATAAAGWATRVAWSSATRWSSRPPSASPSSTPPTRGWSSAASTCGPSVDPEPRYVGRIGLRDADRDSLLIDWRAPAAAVFYQATAAEPHDVVRRRVLRCAGPQVVGVEDELLDAEAGDRPADHRRGRADGAALPRPRPLDALDRRDHPGRAGQGDPRARQGRRLDLRRPRHRQDGRRAAPRGVPPLHRPPPLRGRRRADRRPQRRLHALHRAGAAQPRRDRGRAALARRGRRRRAGDPPRRAGGRRRQGLRSGWPS